MINHYLAYIPTMCKVLVKNSDISQKTPDRYRFWTHAVNGLKYCLHVDFVYVSRLTTAQNADEFYTLMGELTQDMLDGKIVDEDVLIEVVIDLLLTFHM